MREILPKRWTQTQIENIIVSLESGGRPKGGVKGILQGIPSIGGEHLNDIGGFKVHNTRYIPESYYKSLRKGHIGLNDILIVKDGATTGKTSFVDASFPFEIAVVNEHVFVLKIHNQINPKAIFFFLLSQEGNRRILENFQGSAQGGINRQFISNTLVPLPPLPEQKRIVAKLDKIMPRIDKVKERLEKIPTTIKRFRQSVLTDAVTGKLTEKWREANPGEENVEKLLINKKLIIEHSEFTKIWNNFKIPNNWKCTYLKEIAELRLGKMLDANKNTGNKVSYLGNVNVRWFFFNLNGLKQVKMNEEEFKKLSVKDGDIFICEGGEPGRAAVWKLGENQITFQKALHRARFTIPMISDWLVYNLKVDADTQTLDKLFTGTTIKHFTGRSLAVYPIPLPPLEEQKEIVRQVDKLFALADKLEEHYRKAKTKVDKLTQSVLAKAFRGELVPQDPNDEPAEKLLERIQKEKAKMEAGLKKSRRKTKKANKK